MKEKYITLTAFSKRTKIPINTVRNAIKSGRIKSVERSSTGRVIGILPKKALAEYKANTDPSQAIKTKMPKAAKADIIDYARERALREHVMRKTAEMEYLQAIGELVSAQEAKAEAHEIATRLKNNVFGLATKHSQKLASLTDPLRVDRLIREELTKIFDECSRDLSESLTGGAKERKEIMR